MQPYFNILITTLLIHCEWKNKMDRYARKNKTLTSLSPFFFRVWTDSDSTSLSNWSTCMFKVSIVFCKGTKSSHYCTSSMLLSFSTPSLLSEPFWYREPLFRFLLFLLCWVHFLGQAQPLFRIGLCLGFSFNHLETFHLLKRKSQTCRFRPMDQTWALHIVQMNDGQNI